MEHGKKHWQTWKMRNAHCGTGIWVETVENVENEKCTLYDLYNRENTEIRGKWETHNIGSGIWKKNSEKVGKWQMHTLWPKIWRETLKNFDNEKCTI